MFRGRPYRPDEVPGPEAVLRTDGHWSTEGLVLYCPMLEGAGKRTLNYARDNPGELWGVADWGGGSLGGGARVDAGGAGGVYNIWRVPKTPDLSLRTTDSFTFGSVWIAATLHDGHPLVSRNAGSPYIWWRVLSTGNLDCFINDTAASLNITYPHTAGVPYTSIGSWCASTSTLTAVVNGEVKAVTQALQNIEVTSGTYWATRNQQRNWKSGVYSRPFIGLIMAQMIWRRALSVPEMQEFMTNRHLPLWRSARVRIFDMGLIFTPRPQPPTRMGPRMVLGG